VFYVLLTVHLDAILGNDQLDALFLMYLFLCLYMFRAASAHQKAGTADSHSPECVIPDEVLIQFGPPDDEHLLLETCRGIKINTLKRVHQVGHYPELLGVYRHRISFF
jgi:hypothetical protein